MKFLFEGGTSNFWSNIDGSGGGSWGGSDGGFAAQNTLTVAQLVFVGLQKMWGGGGGENVSTNEPYELEGVEVVAPRWYQKAWKWVKGINFHFDFEFDVSVGLQVARKINGVGFDVNFLSGELLNFKLDGDVDFDKNEALGKSEFRYARPMDLKEQNQT